MLKARSREAVVRSKGLGGVNGPSSDPSFRSPFCLFRSSWFRSLHGLTIQMSNREDSVYLAKLAEQAERYEGESTGLGPFPRVVD